MSYDQTQKQTDQQYNKEKYIINVWEYFHILLKKGKWKESYIFIVYSYKIIRGGGGLLLFCDNELTTYRN